MEGLRSLFGRWDALQRTIVGLRRILPDSLPEGFAVMPAALVWLQCEMSELFTGRTYGESESYTREVESSRSEDDCEDAPEAWDAGWIAPDGTFYGENGSMSSLLHISIAEKLYEAGVVPSESLLDADMWMLEHGWCKVRGNHVLFEGYMQVRYGVPPVRLTEAQRDALVKYGNEYCGGSLVFGMRRVQKSTSFLKNVEPLMLGKLFDQD